MSISKDATRRRLGRGLSSLISSPVPIDQTGARKQSSRKIKHSQDAHTSGIAATALADGETLLMIEPGEIHPNPHQPRKHFDEDSLKALASSIQSDGLMQPIIIRPRAEGGYELVAGERRLRAAQLIELHTIPSLVREVDEQTSVVLALIENLQREDLNPIERSEAFSSLIDDYGLTHKELADRLGMNRSSMTNFLRLMELSENEKAALRDGDLSMGHAKVLLSITSLAQRSALAKQTISQGWSVRELERRTTTSKKLTPQTTRKEIDPHLQDLQKQLGEHLGTKVSIQQGKKKGTGRLIVDFYSLEQFDGLLEQLGFSCK